MSNTLRPTDRGSVTVWIMGLTVMIGMLGFLVLAIYVPFSERRGLAGAADQAAQAGATALDEDLFRSTGVLQLDPVLARERALQSIENQNLDIDVANSSVDATADEVTVVLEAQVNDSFISIFDQGDGPLIIRVTATGTPREDSP